MENLKSIERHACFGGWQEVWEHDSVSLACKMKFAVFIPEQAKQNKLPVLYWLSGLTCTEQNFIAKSGMQQFAAKHGLIVVAPDTSPRGDGVADDEAYDLGQGAGFYLNATVKPWSDHYHMYNYITSELPKIIDADFPSNGKRSLSGHSMGGHGALTIALKNPDDYISVSAFSPIVAPSQVPWGQKAFTNYLGQDKSDWLQYDAVELILSGHKFHEIFIDQGLADQFLDEQLQTSRLDSACKQMSIPSRIRYQKDYDHSYYFVASFLEDHFAYHANKLAE